MKYDLGARVKDSITTFQGIIIARSEFLNGCIRYTVQPEELKDGKTIDAHYFDEQQLVLLASPKEIAKEKKVPEIKQSKVGGPHDPPKRAPDVKY